MTSLALCSRHLLQPYLLPSIFLHYGSTIHWGVPKWITNASSSFWTNTELAYKRHVEHPKKDNMHTTSSATATRPGERQRSAMPKNGADYFSPRALQQLKERFCWLNHGQARDGCKLHLNQGNFVVFQLRRRVKGRLGWIARSADWNLFSTKHPTVNRTCWSCEISWHAKTTQHSDWATVSFLSHFLGKVHSSYQRNWRHAELSFPARSLNLEEWLSKGTTWEDTGRTAVALQVSTNLLPRVKSRFLKSSTSESAWHSTVLLQSLYCYQLFSNAHRVLLKIANLGQMRRGKWRITC